MDAQGCTAEPAAHLDIPGSALAYAGQMDEARRAIRRLLELQPVASVTWRRQHRLHPEEDFEYVLDGARLAGLPE